MKNLKSFLRKFFQKNNFSNQKIPLRLPGLSIEQTILYSYILFEGFNEKKDVIVLIDKEKFDYIYTIISQILDESYFAFVSVAESEIQKKNFIEFLYNHKKNNQILFLDKSSYRNLKFPKDIEETIFKKGNEYNYSNIQKSFLKLGYSRTYQVENIGEFAVRGDIIDVFPINTSIPYRLEFWGDEITSVRTFDIFNQRSLEQCDELIILPFENFDAAAELSLFDVFDDSCFLADAEEASFLREKRQNVIETGDEMSEMPMVFIPQYIFSMDSCSVMLQRYPNYKTVFVGSDNRIIKKAEQYNFDEYVKGNLSFGFVIDEIKTVFVSARSYEKKYMSRGDSKTRKIVNVADFDSLKYGDIVVHEDYGIGKFLRIDSINVRDTVQDSFVLEYADGDKLYIPLLDFYKITKYSYDGTIVPDIDKLGSKKWERSKKKIKEKFEKLSEQLILLQAKREAAKKESLDIDHDVYKEFCESFDYELTPDQAKAVVDIESDLTGEYLMDRLVCGDVGFGKTEVAFRAAILSVVNSKQVALIAPTTILAFQHYTNLKNRLSGFPVNVALLTRHTSTTDAKKILKNLLNGSIDIIVGTHKIFGKNVRYKDLGLMIIDEEQKFGVAHKNKLANYRTNLNIMSLSATPIPRTLSMSLGGIKELSVIMTPPKERLPIETVIRNYKLEEFSFNIKRELNRDGQVFIVHNRVNDINAFSDKLREYMPSVRFVVAHGQMKGHEIEDILEDFIDKKYDVLISTTIIENGIDIPDVNTIIINNAQNFGLSQLYQLRGRVGRSNRQAYCILVIPSKSFLKGEAKQRLVSLTHYTELGSGFNIAMRDLEIRGAGNVLGKEQSGFMMTIGYTLYMRMLKDVVEKIKNKGYVSPHQVTVTFPYDLKISDEFIEDVTARATLYSRLSNLSQLDELEEFVVELKDRFGALDKSTSRFISAIKIRIIAGLKNINTINVNVFNELIVRWENYENIDVEFLMSCLSKLKNRYELNFESGLAITFILKRNYKTENLYPEIKNILETVKI